jgi:hypothetical protein
MNKLKTSLMESLVRMYPKLLGAFNVSSSKHLLEPSHFWRIPEFQDGPPFLLLVYEGNSSLVGLEAALRLSRYQKEVRVLRFHHKNPMYDYLGLTGWPAAGYISKDQTSGSIILRKNQDLVDLLVKATIGLAQISAIKYASFGGFKMCFIVTSQYVAYHKIMKSFFSKTVREEPELSVASLGQGSAENEISEHHEPFSRDTVSLEDLLHAVRNILRNEVGLYTKLDGTKLGAFKNFLGILSQFFPADRREVRMFFVNLLNWMRPQREIEVFDPPIAWLILVFWF